MMIYYICLLWKRITVDWPQLVTSYDNNNDGDNNNNNNNNNNDYNNINNDFSLSFSFCIV